MSIWGNLKSTTAALATAALLHGTSNADIVKGTTPALAKQYADYSKKVRLPETRRDISKVIDEASRAKGYRVRGNGLTTKNLKHLK